MVAKSNIPDWKTKDREKKVIMVPAPDKNSKHQGAIHDGKLSFKRSIIHMLGRQSKKSTSPSNHNRVVAGRASRLGVSVQNYLAFALYAKDQPRNTQYPNRARK